MQTEGADVFQDNQGKEIGEPKKRRRYQTTTITTTKFSRTLVVETSQRTLRSQVQSKATHSQNDDDDKGDLTRNIVRNKKIDEKAYQSRKQLQQSAKLLQYVAVIGL